MSRYRLADLVGDLRATYGAGAPREAIALMIEAKRRGMMHQRDVFTSAAILLCAAPWG